MMIPNSGRQIAAAKMHGAAAGMNMDSDMGLESLEEGAGPHASGPLNPNHSGCMGHASSIVRHQVSSSGAPLQPLQSLQFCGWVMGSSLRLRIQEFAILVLHAVTSREHLGSKDPLLYSSTSLLGSLATLSSSSPFSIKALNHNWISMNQLAISQFFNSAGIRSG
jgi:hypothetical protein